MIVINDLIKSISFIMVYRNRMNYCNWIIYPIYLDYLKILQSIIEDVNRVILFTEHNILQG